MKRICLDTSAYSFFKRNHTETVKIIVHAFEIDFPAIVLGELRTGFKLGKYTQKNEKELGDFLENPHVKILDVDDEASHIYSDIVLNLRKNGTPIPTNDIWIAALAIREGKTVVTFDSHFQLIQRVGIILFKE